MALHRFPKLPLRVLQHLRNLRQGEAEATQQANAVQPGHVGRSVEPVPGRGAL